MENILKDVHSDEIRNKPRHMLPSSKNDNFVTPWKLYHKWCDRFKIYPELDVAATHENKKCSECITAKENALTTDWILKDGRIVPWWCNHPHTLHEEFIRKADQQVRKFGMIGMMLLPNNVEGSSSWHKVIEPSRFTFENPQGYIHLYPLQGTIRFIEGGKKSDFTSRNRYSIVIWHKSL